MTLCGPYPNPRGTSCVMLFVGSQLPCFPSPHHVICKFQSGQEYGRQRARLVNVLTTKIIYTFCPNLFFIVHTFSNLFTGILHMQITIVADGMAGVQCSHSKPLSLVWIGALDWLCLEIWAVLMLNH